MVCMQFGGTIISSIEFSGRMSLVKFMAGCPLRCPYCHNAELLDGGEEISLEKIFTIIDENKDFIDAVVISGAEPLYQLDDLKAILKYSMSLNLETKLDTSGMYYNRLNEVIPFVDYVALDIKAPFDKYKEVIGSSIGNHVKKSMELVESSNNTYLECRTTYSPDFLSDDDIYQIADEIFCDVFTIQQFRSKNVLDKKFESFDSPNPSKLRELAINIKSKLKKVKIKTAEFGEETI